MIKRHVQDFGAFGQTVRDRHRNEYKTTPPHLEVHCILIAHKYSKKNAEKVLNISFQI